eukprot:CAMPEP_0113475664 /NCGR_PEP_ID=MMETSP0014_2-20120614/19241_1 /TAXON_ID=2857 /ORGANISM="Nitzschia sp." /LENGTH=501 /DNA_ID=CAMNT_0000368599 /DNA_START=395 /DNA_END=1901 /DNA_ORIENTATION=+ /assembly_acc=CAM_ASM_000159
MTNENKKSSAHSTSTSIATTSDGGSGRHQPQVEDDRLDTEGRDLVVFTSSGDTISDDVDVDVDGVGPNQNVDGDRADGSSDPMRRPDIPDLVRRGEWGEIRRWYENHPDELSRIDQSTGSTVLHALCYATSTPISLLKFVVDAWPGALKVQEKRFGSTPLHILVWSSQRSVSKVELLLDRIDDAKDTMVRNRVLGSTILHSACGNNVDLKVIQAIVNKHRPIVLAKTFDQHTAVYAVWHSHMNSIPGHMQIASILRGRDAWRDNDHFQRFWLKIEYLAMEAFKLSPACPGRNRSSSTTDDVVVYGKTKKQFQQRQQQQLAGDVDSFDGCINIDTRRYIFHGLLDLRAPLNALKVALKIHPEWASVPDADGNYPLHLVVKRRPFRVKDSELIRAIINAYPQAAQKKNNEGDMPLHLAIKDRMVWEEGLSDIVEANVDILQTSDIKTGLYPFMLAAALDGRVAVNTTYQLLIKKPFLVKGALLSDREGDSTNTRPNENCSNIQ